MTKISPIETNIVGEWLMRDNRVVNDEACRRITDLVENHFVEIAEDWTGWETLYQDPTDGRYWELTYPLSHMHGGGPPKLSVIDAQSAKSKYKLS